MTRINRYLDADAPAGEGAGGGASPAADVPAGGDAGAGGGGVQLQTPPVKTEFAWPDGTPAVLKKYKSPDDAAKAFASLQSEFNKVNEQLKKAQPGEGESQQQQSAALSAEEYAELSQAYQRDGSIDETTLKEVSERTGWSEEAVLDMLQWRKERNDAFAESTREILGESITFSDINNWFGSGESPYSAEEIMGFQRLANRGQKGWLADVRAEFERAMSNGYRMPSNLRRPLAPNKNGKVPARSGRPGDTSHVGYSKRSEYQAEYSKAKSANDRKGIQAAMAKLQRTPEHVKNSSEWNQP